jgi:hypothetical protein
MRLRAQRSISGLKFWEKSRIALFEDALAAGLYRELLSIPTKLFREKKMPTGLRFIYFVHGFYWYWHGASVL